MYKTKSFGKFIFFLILAVIFFAVFVYSLIIEPLLSKPVDADFVVKIMFAFLMTTCVTVGNALRSDAELKNKALICTNLFSQKEMNLSNCTVNADVSLSSRSNLVSFSLSVDNETFDFAFTRKNRDIIFEALKNCKFTSTDISELEAKIKKENLCTL